METFLREFRTTSISFVGRVRDRDRHTASGNGRAAARARAAWRPDPSPRPPVQQDPLANETLWEPQQRALAAYDEVFDRFHLDGLVYPAIQMPPFDEVAMAAGGRRSAGPHSNTGWVNVIGVPAMSLPGGFYANGLPFGLEISTKRWKDGDLLG